MILNCEVLLYSKHRKRCFGENHFHDDVLCCLGEIVYAVSRNGRVFSAEMHKEEQKYAVMFLGKQIYKCQ